MSEPQRFISGDQFAVPFHPTGEETFDALFKIVEAYREQHASCPKNRRDSAFANRCEICAAADGWLGELL